MKNWLLENFPIVTRTLVISSKGVTNIPNISDLIKSNFFNSIYLILMLQ